MNYLIKNSIIMAFFAVFYMVSCTDHFETLNTPPTSVTDPQPGQVFSHAVRGSVIQSSNDYWKTHTMVYGAWAQQWAVSDRLHSTPYYVPMFDFHDTDWWSWHYQNLKNLEQVKLLLLDSVEGDDAENDPEIRSRLAITNIYQVYIWERLTGLFGDVPFSEAVQGIDLNTTPSYDRQEDIYPELLTILNNNLDRITDGDFTFGQQDFFYNGDLEMWRKFANSLKLRIGMRLKYAAPQLAQEAVTQAMNSQLISGNDESAEIGTTAGGAPAAQVHPLLNIYRSPAGKAIMGETYISTLVDKDDPRLPIIADPTVNSQDNPPLEWRGAPHGMTAQEADDVQNNLNDYSFPSTTGFVSEDVARPVAVLQYPEVAYLQAEAALEGWGADPSEAENFYQNGIRAALSMYPFEFDEATIDAYILEEGQLSGSDEEMLEQIMTQKWLYFIEDGMQAYLDWRRTGYPVLHPGNAPANNNTIPVRAIYHRDEQGLNSSNYNAVIQRQGPDEYGTRMWLVREEIERDSYNSPNRP